MPDNKTMSIDERRKYLRLMAPRCALVGHMEWSRLLTEMGVVTGPHVKSLLTPLPGLTFTRNQCKHRLESYDRLTKTTEYECDFKGY